MSAGEVVHTSSTGGQKAGNDIRPSLLPAREVMEVSELYGKGAKKYDAHNWTRGYEWSLSYDALQRHLGAFWSGEELDNGEGGTGLQHLACAAFHVLTLMYFAKHHRALDDRHIPPAVPVGTFLDGGINITPKHPTLIFDTKAELSPLDYSLMDIPALDHPVFIDGAKLNWDWTLKRDTLPAGTDGLWQSDVNGLVYWFLEDEWWVMNPRHVSEDPWMLSTYCDAVESESGPFTSYVAPQED